MTPLNEQLRNAADDCTPSPLKDLLNRAADALDVKQEPTEDERDRVMEAIAESIGCCSYDCTRVWSAWSYGTMSQDDFVPMIDDHERLYEIADAAIKAMNHPAPIPDGMVLVPVDPTLEMQHAYFSIIDANMDRVQTDATFGRYANNRLAYQAMLKAAGESHE